MQRSTMVRVKTVFHVAVNFFLCIGHVVVSSLKLSRGALNTTLSGRHQTSKTEFVLPAVIICGSRRDLSDAVIQYVRSVCFVCGRRDLTGADGVENHKMICQQKIKFKKRCSKCLELFRTKEEALRHEWPSTNTSVAAAAADDDAAAADGSDGNAAAEDGSDSADDGSDGDAAADDGSEGDDVDHAD